MVKVRTAKSKGSCLEYDTQYSLSFAYPDITRTAERGYQRQYDLHSEKAEVAVECKRLKGISWNALVKFYDKLNLVVHGNFKKYIVFQSNHQPALVFTRDLVYGDYMIREFEKEFGVKFQKHPSTRVKINVQETKN